MALPPPAADQTVVVTGASSGIGAALARELARRGYPVALVARRADRLAALAAETGGTVEVTDLADAAQRTALVDRLRERDVVGVCNNAGFGTTGPFVAQDLARELELVQLNVAALHHLTLAFAQPMAAVGSGAILNVASVGGFVPTPGTATYGATKAFVVALSEAVHAELAGSGVSVTMLAPGATRTEFGEHAGAADFWRRLPDHLFMEPGEVARQAVDAMVEGRRSVVPGLGNKAQALGGRLVPRSVYLPLAARFAAREMH
jgi:uncharacterized protein